MRKLKPRSCFGCRKTYSHRHLIEGWTALKLESGRWVGVKEIRRYCTNCIDPTGARKLIQEGTVGKTVHMLLAAPSTYRRKQLKAVS